MWRSAKADLVAICNEQEIDYEIDSWIQERVFCYQYIYLNTITNNLTIRHINPPFIELLRQENWSFLLSKIDHMDSMKNTIII